MKKLLVVCMMLALVLTAFAMTAAAETPSIQGDVIADTAVGVDQNQKDWSIVVVNSNGGISPFQSFIDQLQGQNSNLAPIAHKELTIQGDGTPNGAITVTMKVTGATPSSTGYFLLKKSDGSIVQVKATMGDGTATATFDELGEVIFLSDIGAQQSVTPVPSSDGTQKSDKTADMLAPMAAILLVGALAVGVSAKKLFA